MSENRISLSFDDSEEVGSSSAITRASSMTALAISTICRSPIESDDTFAVALMSIPKSFSLPSTADIKR